MEKYNYAYEMFEDMMEFAIEHGMTYYQYDLMHDAAQLQRVEDDDEVTTFLWVVKSNGCGTWLWNCYGSGLSEVPSIILGDAGAKAVIKYDGDGWTFNQL